MVLFPELPENVVNLLAVTDGCFLAFTFVRYLFAFFGRFAQVQNIEQE
jgi:hypothetical protein